MTTEDNGLKLEEIKAYIYSIDFSKIIEKMITHQGWLKKEAETVCEMYRNFLFITRKYQGEYGLLPPSEEIDEFWHNHILDTKKYRKDCKTIFGKYFDHYPYFGIDGKTNLDDLKKSFEIFQKLYKKEFGIEVYKVTSWFSKVIGIFRKWQMIRNYNTRANYK